MATSRTRTAFSPNPNGSHTITYGSGATGVSESLPKPPAYAVTTADWVVPNFKKRSAAGEIFNNPFASNKSWYASNGTYRGEGWTRGRADDPSRPDMSGPFDIHEWANGSLMDKQGFVPYATVPDIDDTVLRNQAMTRASANVNPSDIMALVSVAEWHKTKLIHRQVGSAVLDIMKAVYSRNPGRASSRALANAWMTGRYAVMPFVYELQGAVKLFSRKSSERFTARGVATETKTNESVVTVNDGVWYSWQVRVKCIREYTIRAGILYSSDDLLRLLAGMGATRPLSSAYELMKFSWILDWWIDIGTWLDAMQPDGASVYHSAWITDVDRITHTAIVEGFTTHDDGFLDWSKMRSWSGTRTKVSERKERTPWNGNPPIFPPKGRGLNAVRCADIISLVIQKLGWKRGGYVSGVRF